MSLFLYQFDLVKTFHKFFHFHLDFSKLIVGIILVINYFNNLNKTYLFVLGHFTQFSLQGLGILIVYFINFIC
jgi:hypothetical protein